MNTGSGQRSSLALGLIGPGAFPPVRLPLLVEPANADPLAPPHRDVLLYQVGQHACGETQALERIAGCLGAATQLAAASGQGLRLSLPSPRPQSAQAPPKARGKGPEGQGTEPGSPS